MTAELPQSRTASMTAASAMATGTCRTANLPQPTRSATPDRQRPGGALRAFGPSVSASSSGRGAEIQAVAGADLVLDRIGDVRIVAQVLLSVLAALTDAFVASTTARLLDHAGLDAQIDQLSPVLEIPAICP